MKKKLIIVFLSTLLLSGCDALGRANKEHIHTYGKEWHSTEEGHYRVCMYSECNKKSNLIPHDFSDDYTCATCGYCRNEVDIGVHTHKWSDLVITKEATCTDNGLGERTCTVCGEKQQKQIKSLGHDYEDDENGCIAPTCTENGVKNQTCSRCGDKRTVEIGGIGHEWVDDTVILEPTCTEDGVKTQHCSRCGSTKENITILALGHDLVVTKTPEWEEGFAQIFDYHCTRCEKRFVVWKVNDVSETCKNNKRFVPADEENGLEAFYEPNYIVNSDDSVSFWGRPIHNAIAISKERNVVGNDGDMTPIYDDSVEGSYLEYRFKVDSDMTDLKLITDMKINQYMSNSSKVFTNVSSDWTLGLVDSAENYYETRYVVSLDGNVLEQDLSKDVPATNKSVEEYEFPLKNKLNLTSGIHTLRITMAGGYLANFYSFRFES